METIAHSVILEGVDHFRVVEAMFEGLRVILSYRGENYSPAYIQGIAGTAFRVAGICPCAPTCELPTEPQALAKLLGYSVEHLPFRATGLAQEYELQEVLARVKGEIRAGRPVLVWHAFTTAEWDVVCGFDEDQGLFFGRGSYAGLDQYASAPETRLITCLDICPALGALLVGEKVASFDQRSAEKGALCEAVRHAHTVKPEMTPDGKWVFMEGLQCYDRWVRDFRQDPPHRITNGDRYCLGIYRSTHRAGAAFLRELALTHPAAAGALKQAASCIESEASTFDACVPLIGWGAPDEPDAERNAQVAGLLTQARDAYMRGINAIEQALEKL